MERQSVTSRFKDGRVIAVFIGCLFAGFLIGMLIFSPPWHLPLAWGDIPTWITGIATAVLAVFAIVTVWYARQAFLKQSQEVSDQAAMLQLQSEQLAEQRKINKLQAEDLGESLKERARLRELAEREQADKVGLRMSSGPFPNYSLADVAGFDVRIGEPVHMAVVSNESRRPIRNVVCKYGYDTAVIVGRLADRQRGTSGESPGLFETMPLHTDVVIRGGQTYGFAFEIVSNPVPISEPPSGWHGSPTTPACTGNSMRTCT
jgi:hypothetical protein